MSFFKEVFIDGQLLGILIGSCISYFMYRLSKEDSAINQRNIWKKEFDKYQIEPIVEIFKNILVVIENNAFKANNKPIPQEYLSELKIRTHLIRYFDNDLRQKISDEIYQKCLEYNEIGFIKTPQLSSTENEGRLEKEKRELIEKNILSITDKIKSTYSG